MAFFTFWPGIGLMFAGAARWLSREDV